MSAPVLLRDLVDVLDLPAEWGSWLDRETGAVISLDPETLAAGEEGEAECANEFADAQALAVSRAVATGDPRYLALPDAFDFHEYRHMERFVAGLAEPRVAEPLWRAIKGRGAFRQFKDTARRLGLLEEWFAYRQRAAERHMLDWAEMNGVTVKPEERRRPP